MWWLLLMLTGEPLPTPYSANQIEQTCAPGLEIAFRRTGETPQDYSLLFVPSDHGAALHQIVDGQPGPLAEVSWEELRDHALYDSDNSTRTRTKRKTPLGKLKGWLYQTEQDGVITHFFFADKYPGPPVVLWSTRDGVEIDRLEQVARSVRKLD